MSVMGVETLLYGVEDMAAGRRFWNDFGLTELSASDREVVFETAEGTTVILAPADRPDLPACPGNPNNTVRQTTWGVAALSDLDWIESSLAGLPGVVREPTRLSAVDPNGYAIAFQVTARRPLPPIDEQYNSAREIKRPGRRAKAYAKASPQMMSHVVFFTPKFQEAHDFYAGRLRFKLTDSYPGRSMFFRADGAVEHHNLFFIHEGDKVGFHHQAFEVRSIHEVLGGGLNMKDKGWETLIGPGRHPVSSAYFWYFVNPCGGAAEYDWDSDAVSDDWEPKEWPVDHSTFAEWIAPPGFKRFEGWPAQHKFKGNMAEAEGELVRMMAEKVSSGS